MPGSRCGLKFICLRGRAVRATELRGRPGLLSESFHLGHVLLLLRFRFLHNRVVVNDAHVRIRGRRIVPGGIRRVDRREPD